MASNAMTWPRERRSGSIETKPGAAPGKDLHGGEPGARGAAPSTPARAPSRPGPRSGRARARLSLLPALALLLGALSLFAAAPAEAQTPAAVTSLSVEPGDERLMLSWVAPAGTITSYSVHYTSASTSSVSNSATVGSNSATAWVAAAGSGTTATTITITVPIGPTYRVRVRARNAGNVGPWAFSSGTPYWATTLNVKDTTSYSIGCYKHAKDKRTTAAEFCDTAMTDDEFRYGTTTYTFAEIRTVWEPLNYWQRDDGVWMASGRQGNGVLNIRFGVTTGPDVSTALDDLVLCTAYGSRWQTLRFAQASHASGTNYAGWYPDHGDLRSPDRAGLGGTIVGTHWHLGNSVSLRIQSSKLQCGSATFQGGASDPDPSQQQQAAPLTAAFEKVPAKHDGTSAFTLQVRLSETVGKFSRSPRASSFAVTNGRVLSVEQVGAGLWQVKVQPASSSDVTVTLAGGRDCDDEPSGAVCTKDVRALSNTSTATIRAAVAVSLSATPNPVGEGSPVTVTATLAKALAEAVTVPLTVTRGTSEDGDHGSLASITLLAGFTSVTGTISTVEDDDGDDETFTVALGSLPSSLIAGSTSSVEVTITDKGAQQQQQQQPTAPLTAAFGNVPSEHDGTAFTFDLTLSEAPGAGNLPVAASFKVTPGKASVSGSGTRYTVTVTPKQANAWRDVTITLAGGRACGEAGAVCTADGRALTNTSSANIGGPVRIRIENARAKEGKDASLDFAVSLNRAASQAVSVDYATEDGTAKAGADYTAVSGTLTFAAGETAKTVSVPVLDDAHDEGRETMRLKLSNPKGAYLRNVHRQAKGVIRNDDLLQQAWLARFGRMVASDAVASVTARLETPRDAGSHVTFAGQRVNFGEDGAGKALATVLTGLAQTFGAPSAPAADDDDPFVRHGLTGGLNDPAAVTGARRVTGRELLLGTSFRMVLDRSAGAQWTGWGQGASVSRFSAAGTGLGLTGESATGSMGMDWEQGRLLLGFAMTHSVGEGTARDAGWRYALGSTATMALPYARLRLTDRVSVWGLAGAGKGRLTLDIDGAVPQTYRTDLSMSLVAMGGRGDLLTPAEAGGFALALKADAFWVGTKSDRVKASAFGSLAGARGESSRVRAVLDGSRTFSFASGAALTPKLELGVRHDSGDAETGTGLEVGAGLGYADPSRGLDMALKVHGLAVHAERGYDEWGVSGQLRLVPGGAGRGLSMSLTPSWGVDPAGSQRLWALPASSGLAAPANGAAEPSSRFDAEVGYGLALFGDRFTGTPNVGFGLSETAREYRMGWRLTSAVEGDPGFEVSLDAIRREAANDNAAEHGVMLRSTIRW